MNAHRNLARTFGYRAVDALRDMRESRTERNRDYWATVAAQLACTAAMYARLALAQSARLNSTKGGRPAPAWNGR